MNIVWHTRQQSARAKKRRALALQIVDQVTEVIEHRIGVQFVLSHQRLKFIADAIELRKAFSVSHESVVEVQGVSAWKHHGMPDSEAQAAFFLCPAHPPRQAAPSSAP